LLRKLTVLLSLFAAMTLRLVGQVQVSETAKINAKKTFDAGVKIGFGTDAAVYPHGLNARELAVYISLGMSSLAAIQTATIYDADLLGWSDKIGTIGPGKWADIIAVDADPLKDVSTLHHVKFVMKGGKVVKNEYRQ
jgi:imidazolonepropionase-like amidohydrolase